MIELNDKDFHVKNDTLFVNHKDFKSKQGLIMFKAEWCGHCQNAKPQMQLVSDATGMAFPIGLVDGDNSKLSTKLAGVEGYPTLIFVNVSGKVSGNYNGNRDASEILKAICNKSKVCRTKQDKQDKQKPNTDTGCNIL
jgi:thiol-disulfide isomerase/thioredoxin